MLEVRGIEVSEGEFLALRGISFKVEEGELVTIIGANGAGKSTILRAVMGLVKCRKGEVFFRGEDITTTPPHHRARLGISLVPEGRKIFPDLTVAENLLMGAYLRKDRAGVKSDFEMIYRYFPVLESRHHQWAGTLSGGEQQMLSIGRSLMNRPTLLFLDEPSLGLSPILVQEIFKIIRSIHEEGVTILLVEQNARMALAISDVALILENGRFVMKGNARDLMEDKDVKEFYMGIHSEESAKGYQRWKRKKRWR